MAYYNANRVIKLTRKALGITQEKLSEGVCEVETYSRIENGHRTVRRSTYQKLMEKMGRNTDRRYAVCVSKDGMLLDEKIELERAFKRYDYEAAEKYLNILKEKVDDNLLTRQYMARVEALVEYRRGRISAEALVGKLDQALRITVPEYEQYLNYDITYPFMKTELLILLSMGNAYRGMRANEQGKQIYEAIFRCLDLNYIGEPDNTTMKLTVGRNLARSYATGGDNVKAIEILNRCMELAYINDYGGKVGELLVAIAYDYAILVKKGVYSESYLEHANKYLRQAHYLAAARGEDKLVNEIEKYYYKCFGE